MRWPWRRRVSEPTDDARASLSQACRSLVDAERLDCAAEEVAGRLRVTRDRNGWAAAIEQTMRRPHLR